jgi:hypothetical protein
MQFPDMRLPHGLILANSALALIGILGLLLFRPKASDKTEHARRPKQRTPISLNAELIRCCCSSATHFLLLLRNRNIQFRIITIALF